MPKQDSNDIVIQLPWTVPQQPSVQTIVFQQPAKTHMEAFHITIHVLFKSTEVTI